MTPSLFPTLLADAATALPEPGSAHAVGWLLLALGALATAIGAVWKLLPARRPPTVDVSPSPLTVREWGEVATRKDFEAMRTKNEGDRRHIYNLLGELRSEFNAKLDISISRLNEASERRTNETHRRMDDIIIALGRVEIVSKKGGVA